MATLIAVYNSEGCVGRCDAKCYNATEPKCDCICRGANHGKGYQQAAANTERMAEAWVERYLQERGEQGAAQLPMLLTEIAEGRASAG
jgi:predicted RNase H-like HicB family nuclease